MLASMVLNVFKSVTLGLVLGLAVGVVVSILVVAPGVLFGGVTGREVRESFGILASAGVFGGFVLGSCAPFVRARRRVVLGALALLMLPLAACFAVALLALAQTGTLPEPGSFWVVAAFSLAYVPYVALPAAGAVLVLERLTRFDRRSSEPAPG